MLAQKNRLRKASEFALAVKGKRVSGENFLFYVSSPLSGDQSGTPVKVGLIVGKNVGGSVIRHRVSRQIRHAIAPHLSKFPNGSLLLFRALPGAAKGVDQNVTGEISNLVEKYLVRNQVAR